MAATSKKKKSMFSTEIILRSSIACTDKNILFITLTEVSVQRRGIRFLPPSHQPCPEATPVWTIDGVARNSHHYFNEGQISLLLRSTKFVCWPLIFISILYWILKKILVHKFSCGGISGNKIYLNYIIKAFVIMGFPSKLIGSLKPS